jgi:hypothetical protein
MPDIIQPFVVVSGLAVGVTATTVISENASLPVAVSSFNGLTGAVTGVTVGGANTFTALQSHTVGISSAGLTLTGQFNITNNTPDIDDVLTCFDSNGQAKWSYPPSPIPTLGAANRYISPLVGTTNLTTASTFNGSNIYYFAFMINSTCQVKCAFISAGTAPSGTNTIWAGVYAASRTTGKPTGSLLGSFGSVATTATINTVFVSSAGITLSPGMYWVGYWSATDAVTNFRRVTLDTTYTGPKVSGAITPSATSSYHLYYTQAGTTLPASVGSPTETTGTSITIPVPFLQIV